jgi:ribosomal protein L31
MTKVECSVCFKSFRNIDFGGGPIGAKCASFINSDLLECGYGSDFDYYTDASEFTLIKHPSFEWKNSKDLICDDCVNCLVKNGHVYSPEVYSTCLCCNNGFNSMSDFMYRVTIDFLEESYTMYKDQQKIGKIILKHLEFFREVISNITPPLPHVFFWICETCHQGKSDIQNEFKLVDNFKIAFKREIECTSLLSPLINVIYLYNDKCCFCKELLQFAEQVIAPHDLY